MDVLPRLPSRRSPACSAHPLKACPVAVRGIRVGWHAKHLSPGFRNVRLPPRFTFSRNALHAPVRPVRVRHTGRSAHGRAPQMAAAGADEEAKAAVRVAHPRLRTLMESHGAVL
jgi:hypothetical protein